MVVAYSVACLGMGFLVLNALKRRSGPDPDVSAAVVLTTAFLLGQGFLSNLWLLLAVGKGFSPQLVTTMVVVLSLIGGALSYRHLIGFIKQLLLIVGDLREETWGWRFFVLSTVVLCAAWLTSLGRIMHQDAAGFYMAIAKVIAFSQQLVKLPGYEDFSSIGLQAEMHYAALLTMGSPEAAKLFAFPTILAGAGMLLALGRLAGLGRRGQWIVLAMVFSSSAVISLSGSGKVDLFSAAFGCGAYYWIVRARYRAGPFSFLLAGMFTAFAVVAKLSYLPIMGIGIPLLFIWGALDRSSFENEEKRTWYKAMQGGCFILTGLLLAITPHLVKNSIMFDSPLAPFGSTTLGWLDQAWLDEDTTRHTILTYPLQLFFGKYTAQIGNLSPLILASFPLVLFLPRRRNLHTDTLIMITVTAMASVLVWVWVRPSVFAPRYILASLLLLAIPAARAFEYVSNHEPRPRWLSGFLLGVSSIILVLVLVGSANIYFVPTNTALYLDGRISECGTDPQFCGVIKMANAEIGEGQRLFMITYHAYYFRPDLIQCLPSLNEIETYYDLDTGQQRWSYIYGRGFRYVVLLGVGGVTYYGLNLEDAPDWLAITTKVDGASVLLQLDSTDPSRGLTHACVQTRPRIWESY